MYFFIMSKKYSKNHVQYSNVTVITSLYLATCKYVIFIIVMRYIILFYLQHVIIQKNTKKLLFTIVLHFIRI